MHRPIDCAELWERLKKQTGTLHAKRGRRSYHRQAEQLEPRTLLTVVTEFDVESGQLTVSSDADDQIQISADAGGQTIINGTVINGPVAADTVNHLVVSGGPGANTIDLSGIDENTFSSLSQIHVNGRNGDDTILGSSLDETLLGGPGNDMLIGGGGADVLLGGFGDDLLDSGDPLQPDLLQSGFNDAVGVNSDGNPGSPYTIDGVLEGQGAGEPGWLSPWIRDAGAAERAVVQDEVVFEGDAAIFVSGGTSQSRRTWEDAQTESFTVSQMIQIPAGGNLTFRLGDKDQSGTGGIGVQWRTGSGGTFEVVDTGSVVRDTGIPVPIDEWFEAGMNVDVAAGTWTFTINGVAYDQTVGFRASPVDFDQVTYLVESAAGAYLDTLTIDGPEVAVPVEGDILFGEQGNDVLWGSNGNVVLAGGLGNDQLFGRGGRDVLTGGTGADWLRGGEEEDILLAGNTFGGESIESLSAIREEWASARSLSERIANLDGSGSGPRLNGDVFLNATSIQNDAEEDSLNGGTSSDWLLIDLSIDLLEDDDLNDILLLI